MAATMTDVARLAGVSVSTVSHVVNGTRLVDPTTEARVRDAIDSTGYRHNRLARALARGGGTQSIGVALSAQSNPYLADLVNPIETAVTRLGSTMLLGETHEDAGDEYHLIATLLDRRVDGIILAPTAGAAERTLPLLARAGVPTVLIDRAVDPLRFDQVASDNVAPMAGLVDHLAGHGHRRVALIAGLPGLATSDERLEGYRRGVQRSGLDADPDLVVTGGSDATGAEAATVQLLELPDPPTALVTANNYMTVGALKLLRRRGIRIPDQLAVAGFDDFEWSDLIEPPLTAIAQNWETIGRRAGELLTERMAAPDRAVRTERVVSSLMVRRSCGCS